MFPSAQQTWLRSWLTCAAAAFSILSSPSSHADARTSGYIPTAVTAPWSDAYPAVAHDVRARRQLVILVHVALCDSTQIACGGQGAGDPASLDKNLYWGRAFGVRRFFDETARGFERVATRRPTSSVVLEELVYRRVVSARGWSLEPDATLEQLVVLRAFHGAAIERATDEFFLTAAEARHVTLDLGGVALRLPVHVAGYAGHNRLMDGHRLPTVERPIASVPAFVFACRSHQYFSEALSAAGSKPLVMTRDLMAPEGYVIEAVVNGLGENLSLVGLRERVARSYAKWQRIPERVARSIFAKTAP
jgi:hypothetical protein